MGVLTKKRVCVYVYTYLPPSLSPSLKLNELFTIALRRYVNIVNMLILSL